MLVLVIGGTGHLYGGLIAPCVQDAAGSVSTITPQYGNSGSVLWLVVIVLVGRARMHRWRCGCRTS